MTQQIARPNFGYHCPRIEQAFKEGMRGFANQQDVDSVPHMEKNAEYYSWVAGWCAAKAEALAFNEDHPEHLNEGA